MTRILACDLSKASTGLAGWDGNASRPVVISQKLGEPNLTEPGRVFARLHMMLNDMWMTMGGFDVIYVEKPLDVSVMAKAQNFEAPYLLYGLAAHAASFAEAKGARLNLTHLKSWRAAFIGKQKIGTKRQTLKELTIERCRQLGFNPRNDDEADAFGLLCWACDVERTPAPWIADEVLRPALGAA
jgi:hypothetical protein